MFKEKSGHILLFCAIVTVCTAVLQYLNPGYSIIDGGLIGAILLTIFVPRDLYTWLFGGLSVVLIVAASFYQHDNMDRQQVILQHAFSLLIVVMATLFMLYVKRLYRNIESEKHQVTALFEHATEGIILT